MNCPYPLSRKDFVCHKQLSAPSGLVSVAGSCLPVDHTSSRAVPIQRLMETKRGERPAGLAPHRMTLMGHSHFRTLLSLDEALSMDRNSHCLSSSSASFPSSLPPMGVVPSRGTYQLMFLLTKFHPRVCLQKYSAQTHNCSSLLEHSEFLHLQKAQALS